ncbi:hypothetical protein V866_000777 [Kwoniella sp. B9012]
MADNIQSSDQLETAFEVETELKKASTILDIRLDSLQQTIPSLSSYPRRLRLSLYSDSRGRESLSQDQLIKVHCSKDLTADCEGYFQEAHNAWTVLGKPIVKGNILDWYSSTLQNSKDELRKTFSDRSSQWIPKAIGTMMTSIRDIRHATSELSGQTLAFDRKTMRKAVDQRDKVVNSRHDFQGGCQVLDLCMPHTAVEEARITELISNFGSATDIKKDSDLGSTNAEDIDRQKEFINLSKICSDETAKANSDNHHLLSLVKDHLINEMSTVSSDWDQKIREVTAYYQSTAQEMLRKATEIGRQFLQTSQQVSQSSSEALDDGLSRQFAHDRDAWQVNFSRVQKHKPEIGAISRLSSEFKSITSLLADWTRVNNQAEGAENIFEKMNRK